MKENDKDAAAIQYANREIYRAFETLDFNAAASHLTEDCDYITFNGMHLMGRAAYIRSHKELMNNFMFRGAALEGNITDIRFANEKTAIVIARGAIRFRWQKKAPKSRQSISTSVWVKDTKGAWKMTSFHNCRVKPLGWLAKWLLNKK